MSMILSMLAGATLVMTITMDPGWVLVCALTTGLACLAKFNNQ